MSSGQARSGGSPAASAGRRRGSTNIIGEDAKGVSDLVTRLMAKTGSKARKASVTAATTDELAARWRRRVAVDRATKVVTTMGDSVIAVAISEDETMFVGAGGSMAAVVYSSESGELVSSPREARLAARTAHLHARSPRSIATLYRSHPVRCARPLTVALFSPLLRSSRASS